MKHCPTYLDVRMAVSGILFPTNPREPNGRTELASANVMFFLVLRPLSLVAVALLPSRLLRQFGFMRQPTEQRANV